MPKKIRISGEIGWTVSASEITSQLDEAAGEDLDIEIASPGGSVFSGLEIYNAIRAYKANHPNAQIMIIISGLAASMASYIAAVDAADIVAAYDNAVGMYHNPWNYAVGDYREMQKNMEFLKGLAGLLGTAYARRSGKSAADITSMMDAETWLFGEELKTAGFVDEIIESEEAEETDKAAAIAAAKLRFGEMLTRAKTHREDPDRVAAMMRTVLAETSSAAKNPSTAPNPAVGGTKPTPDNGAKRGKVMDLKQLQTEHPDIYAEAVAAGVKQEKERVGKALALMRKPEIAPRAGLVARIQDGIEKGEEYNEIVLAVTSMLTAALESPDDIKTGVIDTATGEQPKAAAVKTGFVEEA